jgi:CMP-N,N'-diacetyllegionaminic acid synthase
LHIDKKIVLHKRVKKDVSSNSRTIDSILNFLKNYSGKDIKKSNLILLQPTTPFRNQKELNSIISTFTKSAFDSIVSIRLVDSPHPAKAFRILGNKIDLKNKNTSKHLSAPRQELPRFYSLDGGYYILKISTLLSSKKIIQSNCGVFLRHGYLSVNVDNMIDLEFARHVELRFSK